MRTTHSRITPLLAAALAGCLTLASCASDPASDSDGGVAAGNNAGGETLSLLAGSEIKSLEPILETAEQELGIDITLDYTGTLSGAEQIATGGANTFDGVWFSSNRYLDLMGAADEHVAKSETIMVSPVVLGLQKSVADSLGWSANPPTWGDMAKAAGSGEFTYGMTNPSASNSGFSALVAVATALSGGGAALDDARAQAVQPQLKEFFTGQKLTSGSSGWLADRYVTTAGQPASPDGIINYESVILDVADKTANDPLVPIYPSDGVITADYPLTLLKSADDDARDAYTRLVDWLLQDDVQQRIMEDTARRPINPTIDLQDRFTAKTLVELPFPATRSTVDNLVSSYLNNLSARSQTVYVLDTSGSMKGRRFEDLNQAFETLATGETSDSATTRFSTFRDDESLLVLAYSSQIKEVGNYTLDAESKAAERDRLLNNVNELRLGGSTATYDALAHAYERASELQQKNPDRFTSVVLLTDGHANRGRKANEFVDHFHSLPAATQGIPTFAIIFGDAVPEEVQTIAEVTNGRAFDAREESLGLVMQEIRGYQ